MPKGRGANTRRQTYKQRHPERARKREPKGTGLPSLLALYERSRTVNTERRKRVEKALKRVRRATTNV